MNSRLMAIAFIGLACGATAASETVYRSVDAEGNVVFSDRAPAEGAPAESVQLPQGPSEEAIQRAQERLRETEARADELTRQRHERERLRLEAKPPTIIYPPPTQTRSYGYPVYRRPGRPPYHPSWPHPRPPDYDDDHPAYWPPSLPPAGPVRPTPLPSPAPAPGASWGKAHR